MVAVNTPPMCRKPVGLGAKRVTFPSAGRSRGGYSCSQCSGSGRPGGNRESMTSRLSMNERLRTTYGHGTTYSHVRKAGYRELPAELGSITRRSVPLPPGRRALEARDGGALGGRVRPLLQGQRLDRAVEAVTSRAPDLRALQWAVRRPH